jgi:hypothetical protein
MALALVAVVAAALEITLALITHTQVYSTITLRYLPILTITTMAPG